LKFDLHCHSTASDGKLSPEAVAELVQERDVELFALTDHDTIAGYSELKASGALTAKYWVSGIEFSTLALKQNIHIIGLDFDENHPHMLEALAHQAQARKARAKTIALKLTKAGLPDVYEDALALSGSADSIGRPHFAQALLAKGYCHSEQRAFDRWLGAGKIGDVKAGWPTMEQAVEWIKASGGVAVIAHPLRYKMTFSKLRLLIEQFANCGGDAVEVVDTQAKPDKLRHLIRVVDSHGLAGSGGSDFHDPSWRWAPLGEVGEIPASLEPVWQRFSRTIIS